MHGDVLVSTNVLLNYHTFPFEKGVDPDQLVSSEAMRKPADQDPHYFPYSLRLHHGKSRDM